LTRAGISLALVVVLGAAALACGRQRAEPGGESLAPQAQAEVEGAGESPEHFVAPPDGDADGDGAGSASAGERRLEAFARYVEGLREPSAAAGETGEGQRDRADQEQLDALRERIERVLARLDERAEASVHVRELGSGAVLFDDHGDRPLNPASNHKLVTAAAAIDLLGPDYRFETRVLRAADRLYLVGEGDPSIDGDVLHELAREVAARVTLAELTTLVVDDTAFSSGLVAPGFDPEQGEGASYVAPSGALSLNFNTVEIVVRGTDERRPSVHLREPSAHLVVANDARHASGPSTVAARSTVEHIEGDGEQNGDQAGGRVGTRTRLELRGTLARDERVKLRKRVADPGLYTGGAFARMLARAGHGPTLAVELAAAPILAGELPDDLEATLPLTTVARDGTPVELVAVLRSAPLHELVGRLLTFSNNFMAEQLLRTLGWRLSAEPGDWTNGAAVLRRYWAALGNDPGALAFENGSGLSDNGRVSSAGLVELLALSMRTQLPGARLVDALPTAGKSGTLGDRLTGTDRRIRAKTGTLDGVSALTGFILDREREPAIAFSIVINVVEGAKFGAAARHAVEDDIVRALLRYVG